MEGEKGWPRSGMEVKYLNYIQKFPYVRSEKVSLRINCNEMPLFIAFNFIQQKRLPPFFTTMSVHICGSHNDCEFKLKQTLCASLKRKGCM